MNSCHQRGEQAQRSPLWSIREREYTGGTDVTDLALVGASRWRRHEPRNIDMEIYDIAACAAIVDKVKEIEMGVIWVRIEVPFKIRSACEM